MALKERDLIRKQKQVDDNWYVLRQALKQSLAIVWVNGRNLTDLVPMLHVGTGPRAVRYQVNHRHNSRATRRITDV